MVLPEFEETSQKATARCFVPSNLAPPKRAQVSIDLCDILPPLSGLSREANAVICTHGLEGVKDVLGALLFLGALRCFA